jgi:hypothetical protein
MTINFVLLLKKMEEYIEEDNDRDFIVGEKTTEHMALAARSVLEGIRESQEYGIKEGCFK